MVTSLCTEAHTPHFFSEALYTTLPDDVDAAIPTTDDIIENELKNRVWR